MLYLRLLSREVKDAADFCSTRIPQVWLGLQARPPNAWKLDVQREEFPHLDPRCASGALKINRRQRGSTTTIIPAIQRSSNPNKQLATKRVSSRHMASAEEEVAIANKTSRHNGSTEKHTTSSANRISQGHADAPHKQQQITGGGQQTHNGKAHSSDSASADRLVGAFEVTLLVRSRNPTADAHDPNLGKHEIPSHHVPSLVSLASKTLRSKSTISELCPREKAKAWPAVDAVTSSMSVPPAYWRSGGSKRFAHPAASQADFSPSALPLLSFRNPWESFKPPGLLSVWQGLKWGLPSEYNEGGHSKYRGQGRRANKAEEAELRVEARFGKGWSDVRVLKPDWGWVEAERKTWLEAPHVVQEKREQAQSGTHTHETFDRRKEWQDPRVEKAEDHARVTWLGHASTLLQLPPLTDSVSSSDPTVEQFLGWNRGGVRRPLESQQAREIVNQVSTTGNPELSKAGQRRQIVTREGSPQRRRACQNGKAAAECHGPPGMPFSGLGLPVGQGCEKRDSSETSEEYAEETQLDHVRDRSINILFDPVFSKRCSPSQTVGPIRFTEAPCHVDELPPIDIILLSHDHYDHSDVDSLKQIRRRRGNAVHIFAGLGNKEWLCSSAGFKKSQVSELDWWDEAILTSSDSHPQPRDVARAALRIICTPAQHGSGRVPGGKDSTLWCSWVVEQISPAEAGRDGDLTGNNNAAEQRRWRAFFAGDTGLRRHGEKVTNRRSPLCPAFQEIARRYGTPHLFLLPISIGSSLSYLRSKDPFPRRYSPFPRISESLTSSIHMDAEDAVQMMEIMSGQKAESAGSVGLPPTPVALAVHFGTFVRNAEQTKGDIRNLYSACQRHSITFGRTREGRYGHLDGGDTPGRFLVSHQGETVWVKM